MGRLGTSLRTNIDRPQKGPKKAIGIFFVNLSNIFEGKIAFGVPFVIDFFIFSGVARSRRIGRSWPFGRMGNVNWGILRF